MRYQTTGGQYVTAATKAEAAALAAQCGFGEIAKAAPAPPKPKPPMTLATASRMAANAQDWPRCGQGWPENAREREADAILSAAGGTGHEYF